MYIYYFKRCWMKDLCNASTKVRHHTTITFYLLIAFLVITISCKVLLLYLLVRKLFLIRYTFLTIAYAVLLQFEFSALNRVLKVSKLRIKHLQLVNLSMDVTEESCELPSDAGKEALGASQGQVSVIGERTGKSCRNCSESPSETSDQRLFALEKDSMRHSSMKCPSDGSNDILQTLERQYLGKGYE